jgi:hypothetical protein
METTMKKVIGIFLLPFLYVRYSFLVVVPAVIVGIFKSWDVNVVCAFTTVCFIVFTFFSITFLLIFLKYWTKLLIKVLKIEYKTESNWMSPVAHSGSVWSHPVLCINDKKFNITTSSSGCYDEDISIRRKAIFYYLFY